MLSWLKTAVVDIYTRRHPIKRNSRLMNLCWYNSESKVSEKMYLKKYIAITFFKLNRDFPLKMTTSASFSYLKIYQKLILYFVLFLKNFVLKSTDMLYTNRRSLFLGKRVLRISNRLSINPLSANPTKWPNTLEQFVFFLFECVWQFCEVGT